MAYPGPRLRPMTAGDIVDEAISLYRQHFRAFILIGAVLVVPLGALQILVALLGDQTDLGFLALWSLVSTGLSFLVYTVLWAAMARASASAFLAEPVDPREVFSTVFGSIWQVLLLALAYAVVVFALMFFFLIGIYFAIAWAFGMHVLLVEGRGIGESLSRSRALVQGHWWRIFAIALIAAIIQAIIVSAFSLPAMIAGGSTMFRDPFAEVSPLTNVLSVVGNAAGTIVAGPIIFCTVTLLYFDLRIRKEGYDLEYQAAAMEAALDRQPSPEPTF